ncbi:MAG: DUF2240 family protein [Candidatus Thermoplasmatota archaeon]|nr:DUF2240 family protein [Candidatus Thermoplasmatota archaeon]
MKKALAFLFQRAGEKIEKDDFIYIQSADLDWYSSEDAEKLLDRALESRLIELDDDEVIARFDFEEIEIPMGFEPSNDLLKKEKEEDLFSELLNEAVDRSDLSRQDIMALVNKKQDKINVEPKTAILLVAREKNIDIPDMEDYIDKIAEDIRKK